MRTYLERGILVCSPNLVVEGIQRLATRLVTGIRHLSYEERLQRLGLHSLQRLRVQTDLVVALQTFTDLPDVDPNLFFLPPTPTRYFKVRGILAAATTSG